jgi:hypothetical protein
MNNFYLRPPPMDKTLSHLFYTNLITIAHNKIVYHKTPSETLKFLAKDIHSKHCLHFKLSTLPSHISGFHHELLLKENMLMKLCVSNYATLDALVNGANGTFQNYVENNPKPLIWMHFHNPQIGINTRIKNVHIYEEFSTIDKKWTPIKQKNCKKYKSIVILFISS